jgi:hypothetical protein
MKIRPFIIDDVTLAKIDTVKKYANEHPFTKEDLNIMMNGGGTPAGENENLVVIIPVDYRVVYSIEHQSVGLSRHISISVSGNGNWPNLISVDEILALFDFRVRINDKSNDASAYMWQDNETESINILEII